MGDSSLLVKPASAGVSTFTHLGRHASALELLAAASRKWGSNKPDPDLLLVGSGPLEPFTAALLPKNGFRKVTALDQSPDVIHLIARINSMGVSLAEIAEVCKNQGRPNSDLLKERYVQRGLAELAAVGIDASRLVRDGEGGSRIVKYVRMSGDPAIDLYEGDARTYRSVMPADAVFIGLVLMNLGKKDSGLTDQQFIETVQNIGKMVAPGGFLGIGTNPAGLIDERGDILPLLMAFSDLRLIGIFPDNLLIADGSTLRGGYTAIFSKNEPPSLDHLSIAEALKREKYLGSVSSSFSTIDVSIDDLPNLLRWYQKARKAIVSITCSDEAGKRFYPYISYQVVDVPLEELAKVLPAERHTFGLMHELALALDTQR